MERFFALITEKQIKRDIHRSIEALEADIRAFIALHNEQPWPFKWTRSADDILQTIKRFCLLTRVCWELT